jgi:hypothetical protein
MTLVEGEELQRLWSLVSELSSQLSANQQLCQSLQAQADELKGHALHSGTGYTLRRFNLDISKEKFESDLEKINASLVMENHTLAHENKQVNVLLREYEQTLEQIMTKFRSFSHATQQHTLALTSHYETLLANNVYDVASAELSINTSFSEHLTKLGGLVRQALRETDGEAASDAGNDDDGDEAARQGLHTSSIAYENEGYQVGKLSGGIGSNSQKHAGKRKSKHGTSTVVDPRWYGSGGYTGIQGDATAERARQALESQTEEERLRAENDMLRELLRISADLTPDVAQHFNVPAPIPVNAAAGWAGGLASTSAPKLDLGKPRGSRKSLGELPQSEDGSAVDSEAKSDSQDEFDQSVNEATERLQGGIEEEDEEEDADHLASDFKPVNDAERSSARGPNSMSAQTHDANDFSDVAKQGKTGIVVSADIADQIDQGGHEIEDAASVDPILPTTGAVHADAVKAGIARPTSPVGRGVESITRSQEEGQAQGEAAKEGEAASTEEN